MFFKFISAIAIAVASIFGLSHTPSASTTSPAALSDVSHYATTSEEAAPADTSGTSSVTEKNQENPATSGRASITAQAVSASSMPAALSEDDLLKLASAPADTLPLSDSKYVTSGPKKGYIYLCNVRMDNPGSMVNGPWIHGSTWNLSEKVSVEGAVSWPNATFSNVVQGSTRTLSGNGLPTSHTTGVFPVASNDPAHLYDPNPNTISTELLHDALPANPTYSLTPYCMGMEVGVMLSGVPLFNGFDAGLRDAQAHEIQDSCEGHPQGGGEYHYHGLSSCFKDISETTVLGYALDGFPITGPEVAPNKYLSTASLDECHGITSEIIVDGKKKTTYHYVLTHDFPYSVSCFRGKPVSYQVLSGGQQGGQQQRVQGGQGGGKTPPQQAISACSGKTTDASCSFDTPMGTVSGSCRTTPDGSVACVPSMN
ncbi:MAG TPA: YHYH protein [Candidatus Paceibacterota bacterium]|nr:YHYH protein [Candidatus Paceibacterota bacterium]